MSVYGHRQLSFLFFPLLETREGGFTFKGKNYTWEDVARVDIWQEWWPPMGMVIVEHVPRGRITLKDGGQIKINGRALEKKDEPLMPGYQTAFDELTDLFNRQTRRHDQAAQQARP